MSHSDPALKPLEAFSDTTCDIPPSVTGLQAGLQRMGEAKLFEDHGGHGAWAPSLSVVSRLDNGVHRARVQPRRRLRKPCIVHTASCTSGILWTPLHSDTAQLYSA